MHRDLSIQRSLWTNVSWSIPIILHHFRLKKIFFTLLQTFTIPILGKYITGHKNVSHNALYVYTKVTMGRGSACRKVRIAVPGSIPGTNNFLLQLLLSFLFRLKDSPWMSLFFYLFVSLSIFPFLCNLLSKHWSFFLPTHPLPLESKSDIDLSGKSLLRKATAPCRVFNFPWKV